MYCKSRLATESREEGGNSEKSPTSSPTSSGIRGWSVHAPTVRALLDVIRTTVVWPHVEELSSISLYRNEPELVVYEEEIEGGVPPAYAGDTLVAA
jgi:hypothetical protein